MRLTTTACEGLQPDELGVFAAATTTPTVPQDRSADVPIWREGGTFECFFLRYRDRWGYGWKWFFCGQSCHPVTASRRYGDDRLVVKPRSRSSGVARRPEAPPLTAFRWVSVALLGLSSRAIAPALAKPLAHSPALLLPSGCDPTSRDHC